MNHFTSGALLLGFWAIGLSFLRFWQASRDRFFAFFTFAFWLLAIERIPLAFVSPEHEMRPYIYTIRLTAFLLIIAAIAHKNRGAKRS